MAPSQFPDFGRRAKDLLSRDYNFDHKFTLQVPSSAGMSLTATGIKKDEVFLGDINTVYKSGKVAVDVKVDMYSNVSTKITVDETLAGIKTVLSFKIPDHKSGKVGNYHKLHFLEPLLDVHYVHPHMALNSGIGLNPAPLLEFNAAVGTLELSLGGEVGFDAATGAFTKYTTGVSFNKPDFSAALFLMDKGQTVKASYYHIVNPSNGTAVAAEMTHRLSNYQNSFSIGSSHLVDPHTLVKTRISSDGKVAMLCQREWRPKSLVTLSCEYDTKASNSSPKHKLGLALALKP
ncbi:hypothetical protein V2J09_004253 [Rumex salicifolius]